MSPPTKTITLFDLPHRRARQLLATGVPVFVTVDPIEYHGPHLSLHNDRIMSRAMVRTLHARMRDDAPDMPLVMADALPVGVEPVQGPGTHAVPYRTVRELVTRASVALADLGARRVVLMTAHGSPLHSMAIQHGVHALIERGVRAVAPMNVILHDLLAPPRSLVEAAVAPVREDEREALSQSFKRDFHAGFGETSLSLFWAPECVDPVHRDLPDVDVTELDPSLARAARIARRMGRESLARELEYAAWGVGWFKMRPFPGYTGRPRLANAATGEVLAGFAADRAHEAVASVLYGDADPPEPPMQWLLRASLGGRIVATGVPLEAVVRHD